MIGVDSNVLLRMVLDDDPTQSPHVQRILSRSGPGEIFVGLLVVVELAWVLKRGYRKSPEVVLEIVADLLVTQEFTVERPDLVEAAVSDARSANCGIADALIARINEDRGASATLTFDIRAKRLPSMRDAARFQ